MFLYLYAPDLILSAWSVFALSSLMFLDLVQQIGVTIVLFDDTSMKFGIQIENWLDEHFKL